MIITEKDCTRENGILTYSGDLETDDLTIYIKEPIHWKGSLEISEWLEIDGSLNIDGSLQVGRRLEVGKALKVGAWLDCGGWMEIGGALIIGSWLECGGSLMIGECLTVDGALRTGEWLTINGPLSVGGSLTIAGIKTAYIIIIHCLEWMVWIMENHIKIGCQCHTRRQWARFSDNRIAQMDPHALQFWKKNKDWILAIKQ